MKNKVTKKQVNEAIDYFTCSGRLGELNIDDVYYIKILLKSVANKYNLQLIFSAVQRKFINNKLNKNKKYKGGK